MTLTVSSGPPTVTVPDVEGEPQGTAAGILQTAGLDVGQATKQAVDSTQASGEVLDQASDAEKQTDRGRAVDLIVSFHVSVDCPFVEGPG